LSGIRNPVIVISSPSVVIGGWRTLESWVGIHEPPRPPSNEEYTDSEMSVAAFTYDSENHLMTMSETGTSATVQYDGFGNRVSKTVNGVTTRYLVDDLNPTGLPQVMDELNGSGLVERTYAYGLQRIDENQLISNVWTPSFYGYDGGGSVRQLTGTLGTITDSYDYDAFGNKINSTGTTPNNFLYRGEQYDSDLGLYYLRARYYNPLTGRFIGRDPEDGKIKIPATLHKYLYASGDPVNRIDPSGRGDLIEVSLVDWQQMQKDVLAAREAAKAEALALCVEDLLEYYVMEDFPGLTIQEIMPKLVDECWEYLGY
jgi:RHS repeat-associated protein